MTSTDTSTETEIPVAVVLQEAMNIAVGKAAREIEDILRLTMQLHVPTVDDFGSGPCFTDSASSPSMPTTMCTIEQEFYGHIEGLGYLLCEPDALLQISSAFGHPASEESHYNPLLEYAALEVGSILTGSCIGSLAELSGAVVSYGMPRFRRNAQTAGTVALPGGDDGSVILTSVMRLDSRPVDLRLMLVLPAKAGEYIATALCWYA